MIVAPSWLWDGETNRPEQGRCLLIEDGRISFSGTIDACRAAAPQAELIEGDLLVLPGMTDAHDHGRGISPTAFGVPDMPLEMWVQDLWKLPALTHYTATYFDGLRLASAGVTTVLHSHNPNDFSKLRQEVLDSARGYNDAGIRCILCPLFIDQNKGVYADREEFIASLPEEIGKPFGGGIHDRIMTIDEYLELIDTLREELHDEIEAGMVQIQLHPNGGQWCSDESLLRMKEYALANGLRIHLHQLETRYQAIYAQKTWGKTFIEHYEDIGFLGPWLSLAHMIWLTEHDLELLKKYEVLPVNNPSSNIRLRSGVFPLREMVERKIPFGLGLDGDTLDDDQDYLREMRIAFFNIGRVGMYSLIDPMVPLKMGGPWGSLVSGRQLSPGTLTPGSDADLVCIDMEALRRPYADDFADVFEILREEIHLHSVDEARFLVHQQVGVVRNAVWQRPKALEQRLVAVVHAYVVDVFCDGFHVDILVF